LVCFYDLKLKFRDHNFDLATNDLNSIENSEIVIYFEIPEKLPLISEISKSYLLLLESEIIIPKNYDLNSHKYFNKIFTWNDNLVDDKKWINESDFKEGLALSQLAPGPLAAQLGIYIGFVHFGVLGASLSGLAFVLPSFIMVVLLGMAYQSYGGLPWMQAVFYGISAAVIGFLSQSKISPFQRDRLRFDRNENIFWFNVAMNESFRMNVSQSFGQLKKNFDFPWKWRLFVLFWIIIRQKEQIEGSRTQLQCMTSVLQF
jgi:hypothetical protein